MASRVNGGRAAAHCARLGGELAFAGWRRWGILVGSRTGAAEPVGCGVQAERVAVWGRGAGRAVVGILLVAVGCASADEKGADNGLADDVSEDSGGAAEPDPEPVEVGAFRIEGSLVDAMDGGAAAEALCLRLWDPSPVSRGEAPVLLWEGESDSAGAFTVPEVTGATTMGLVLESGACDGDDPVRTGTTLDVDELAGRGPGRDLTGVALPVLRAADRDALDAELTASGATVVLADAGGIFGTITDPEWGPVEGGWVRGPDPGVEGAWYAPWYDKGGGEWESYDGSSAAGGARFIVPGAPWGAWLCRAAETDFPVLIGGGIEGLVLVHEFAPW